MNLSRIISISKGLNLPIEGAPEQAVYSAENLTRYIIAGDDYPGLKPTMNVQEGDFVRAGDVLFSDKKNPGVSFISPYSGVVRSVSRGAKRKFLSLDLEIESREGKEFRAHNTSELSSLDEESVRRGLSESGLWVSLIARPFGRVASPESSVSYIYVNACDTRPLAADVKTALNGRDIYFKAGLLLLEKLAGKKLYVCVQDEQSVPYFDSAKTEYVCFKGPHPSGLSGTHIHFLAPAHAENKVWEINYQDTAGIGEFFLTGKIPVDYVISLCGPSALKPRLLKARYGACVSELTKNEGFGSGVRAVSGSVLYGRKAEAPADCLHRYIPQLTLLPEGGERKFMGWAGPGTDMHSVKRIFLTGFGIGKPKFDTSLNGGRRPMVPVGSYESVMPQDILITYLLRSVSVGDVETSEKLGCLELLEEDLSLCTYACPGKQDYGPMLRQILDTIEKEG